MDGNDGRAFKGYVLKIASRCNLNCTYCYMYNLADQRWRSQPKQMTAEALRRTVERIRDHSLLHGLRRVNIGLHGGEPLLVGPGRLEEIIDCIRQILRPVGIDARITVQSNGLLFDERFGDLFGRKGVTIGVSTDGPPAINDLHRVDHRGRGSSARLETRLQVLSRQYRGVFAGLLCVVNPTSDPIETFDYLASFDPPTINFLLPLDHHDRRPPGKEGDLSDPLYGRWLAAAFDRWAAHPAQMRVLMFNSFVNLLNGKRSLTESHGLDPAKIIVVETNGDIEAVDSLKATDQFAAVLGLNVAENSFDEAYERVIVQAMAEGIGRLPTACQECDLVAVCGGGDPPTRYSRANGFRNVSVYCADYAYLISHVRSRMLAARQWMEQRHGALSQAARITS